MARIPVTLENGGAALATADALLAAIRKHTENAMNSGQGANYQQYEAATAAKLGEALDAVTRYLGALDTATAPQPATRTP